MAKRSGATAAGKATHVVHPLDPVYDQNSRVLVLGSFPSPKSRSTGFNYGHPQNRFWRVMAALFDEPIPTTNERKEDMMLRHHIALWDVVASCTIEGASDTTIRDVVPNDFSEILENSQVEAVFCTGAKAAELYTRHCEKATGIPCVKLPSTSPANAATKLDALVEAYRVILPHLHEYEPPTLDVADVVALEQTIAAGGTSLAELMDRAGRALAHRVMRVAPEGRQAVILCGSGNNGGDGWVAARDLAAADWKVTLVAPYPAAELKAQPAHDTAVALEPELLDAGVEILQAPDSANLTEALAQADVIIDAILGTGFSGNELREPYASWIETTNAAHAKGALVVAADVPSGLSAQTGAVATPCIQADHTVTMIVSKPGLTHSAAGQVHVAPLAYLELLLA